MAILLIRLYEPWAECRLCGADTPSRWGVPMYEGNLLSNDFQGEWFGAPACQACHDAHARGELRTYDHLYTTAARPLFEELLLGETSRVLKLLRLLTRAAQGLRATYWI